MDTKYKSTRTIELEQALKESQELDSDTTRIKVQFWNCLTPDEKYVLYQIAKDYFNVEGA